THHDIGTGSRGERTDRANFPRRIVLRARRRDAGKQRGDRDRDSRWPRVVHSVLLWRYWFSALLGRSLLLALREPVAERGQNLLSDRLHVGAGHLVRQSTELGFGQRGVESRKVLVFSELFADGVGAPDHHDAGP